MNPEIYRKNKTIYSNGYEEQISSPYPKGILLQHRYLWKKENYLTLYRYEINASREEAQKRLWH